MESSQDTEKGYRNLLPMAVHGTFDDYEPLALLKTFCKQAVQGTGRVNTLCGLTDPTDKCRTTP